MADCWPARDGWVRLVGVMHAAGDGGSSCCPMARWVNENGENGGFQLDLGVMEPIVGVAGQIWLERAVGARWVSTANENGEDAIFGFWIFMPWLSCCLRMMTGSSSACLPRHFGWLGSAVRITAEKLAVGSHGCRTMEHHTGAPA
ncbi:hypothetical protein ACLOJK_041954, partial [Asimina triloba]